MPGIAFLIVLILTLSVADENPELAILIAVFGLYGIAHIFKNSKHEWIDTFWSGAFAFIVFGGGIALVVGLLSHLFK